MLEFEIFGQTISFVWEFMDFGMTPLDTLRAFFEGILYNLSTFFG